MWASRSITKTWTRKKENKQEGQVATQNVNTISFVRFGELKQSKSKLINSFLTTAQGKQEKTIFLTRDEDCSSKLSHGTIEMCWFAPEEESQEDKQGMEHIDNLTCIYNLR